MPAVSLGVGLSDHRTRFAQPKTQRPEQTLTLSHAQSDAIATTQILRQRFPIPEVRLQAGLFGRLSQHGAELLELLVAEAGWATGPLAFLQPGQTTLPKRTHPILDRAGRIAQPTGHLPATHSLGHHQQPVEPMIVARFPGALDLLLQRQNDRSSLGNAEGFHAYRKPQKAPYAR